MNESDFGMVPRTVRHLFYKAEVLLIEYTKKSLELNVNDCLKEYPSRQISIQASYLEIYDEEIHDLLSVEPFHGEITIQEDHNVTFDNH